MLSDKEQDETVPTFADKNKRTRIANWWGRALVKTDTRPCLAAENIEQQQGCDEFKPEDETFRKLVRQIRFY